MSNIHSYNSLIKVGGIALPQPYLYTWSLQDVSAPNAGRTEDSTMHKNLISQKRKLQLGWRGKSTADTSFILQRFQPEYIMVEYFDLLDNMYETREFYTGDRTANIKLWFLGRKLIETISFDIIER